MPQLTGQNRHQSEIFCLDDYIAADNEVRLIDAFVNSLDMAAMEFKLKGQKNNGRPTFQA